MKDLSFEELEKFVADYSSHMNVSVTFIGEQYLIETTNKEGVLEYIFKTSEI